MFTIEDFILSYFPFQLEKEFCATDRRLALGQRRSLQTSGDCLRDFWAKQAVIYFFLNPVCVGEASGKGINKMF